MLFSSKRHLHSSDLENRMVLLMCATLVTGPHKPTADKPAANLSFIEGSERRERERERERITVGLCVRAVCGCCVCGGLWTVKDLALYYCS